VSCAQLTPESLVKLLAGPIPGVLSLHFLRSEAQWRSFPPQKLWQHFQTIAWALHDEVSRVAYHGMLPGRGELLYVLTRGQEFADGDAGGLCLGVDTNGVQFRPFAVIGVTREVHALAALLVPTCSYILLAVTATVFLGMFTAAAYNDEVQVVQWHASYEALKETLLHELAHWASYKQHGHWQDLGPSEVATSGHGDYWHREVRRIQVCQSFFSVLAQHNRNCNVTLV
jgi:hypothetical protein